MRYYRRNSFNYKMTIYSAIKQVMNKNNQTTLSATIKVMKRINRELTIYGVLNIDRGF